jgi:xanthine/CO dehydrogenase XdhC/CoxF family maturation factor
VTERSIVEAAARLRRHGEPYLVATVVATNGPAYRRPGARMILTRFRWVAGNVSGGCMEGDIASNGWADTRHGATKLVTYDAAQIVDDDDLRSAFGLGEGTVEVLLERSSGMPGRIDALEVAARCLGKQQRGAVATVFETDGDPRIGARIAMIASEAGLEIVEENDPFTGALRERLVGELRSAIESGTCASKLIETARGTVRVLVEAMIPPPTLFVFGTGHDAVPIARMAHDLGWCVVICAKDARHATRDRFPVADEILVGDPAAMKPRIEAADRAVAVIIGHDHTRDRDVLGMLLDTHARFIGVCGPARRTSRMLTELLHPGDARLHATADIGIDAPQAAALTLLAEIQDALKTPVIVELPRERASVTSSSRPSAVLAVAAVL